MPLNNIRVVCLAGILVTALSALDAQSVNSTMTVPRTVRYSGSFRPADGLPTQPVEGLTIAVYRDQTGGDPLWQETQNVQVDASGNFAVEMGVTQNGGLPLDLLRTGEPRWMGVRINRPGEAEQPRVQMLSVPYALRASDAETLGGLPASAYLVNPSAPGAAAATSGPASANAMKPHVTSGTSNYIGLFTNPTDLGNSVLYQNGGKMGLNTVNPLDYFHIAFNDATGNFTGYSVQNLGSGAASYSGLLFYDQNGALVNFQGFNNSTHEYRINNIALNGSINFMLGSQSKFQVRGDGDINFAGSIRKGGALFLHNLGINDTAVGLNALAVSTGTDNTAIGIQALTSNTTGGGNTASGSLALQNNTTGNFNTASGTGALQYNTTGTLNTAGGINALNANTAGTMNTAIGASALLNNTIGSANTAIGLNALQNNTTGYLNTAAGQGALRQNTAGYENVAIGLDALYFNASGAANTAIGWMALMNSTGSGNIAIGALAGLDLGTGVDNIMIANTGTPSDNLTVRLGQAQTSTYIVGIRSVTTGASDAVNVVIDSNDQLGTINSSRRFKEDIRDMGDASNNLMRLRPVTYHYKQAYADGSKPLDYGLIAEEVAEIYPDLVVKSKDGQVETVQYQKLTPLLLNEVQKQVETIRKLQDQNRDLESRLAALETLMSQQVATNSGR